MISTLVLFGILPVIGVTIIALHIVGCKSDHREINTRIIELDTQLKEVNTKLDRRL